MLYGATSCDFVIWSIYESCYIERIQIDHKVCNIIMSKGKLNFYKVILPELLEKHFTNNSFEQNTIETRFEKCNCKKL